jgi:Tol biopolymer transport system component
MIGETLLHYEIKDRLGKGGMGEVFAARDTKLGRDVAVKILPSDLAGDAEREMRFQREARALASLQHPNVASVYGFEEAGGVRFLVMELVSGVELTRRMQEGPIAPDETRRLARQIAAGLEAAHEAGIVHRDLKPSNVMVTAEGDIKILDFGLAQAWFGDGPNQGESSAMPTITAAVTQIGAILGTAAYMSPEQARGANVDRRADIWAFGVILFEMLSGKPLFHGETVSDTLAAVLRAELEWDLLPVQEAPALCRLIERCLERNPKQRLRDIGEARIFLQDGGESSSHLSLSLLNYGAVAAEAPRARPPVLLLALVAVAALAAGAGLGWKVLARSEPAPVLHTMIPPPRGSDYDLRSVSPGPAMISPDGTMIAYSAIDESGQTALYLRHLDQGESVKMSGTESAVYPFWSPDSRYIGFFEMNGGKLRKVAVAGGPPVTLCAATNGKGGTWNAAGQIVFAAEAGVGLSMVPEIGGDPVPVTLLDKHDSHRHPRFLPDGKHFVFTGRPVSGNEANDIMIAVADTAMPPRVIATSQAHADYADGHLLTVRENVLMATPYTPDQERVIEGGTPIVEDVLVITGADVAVFSPSATGMMVFQTGASYDEGQVLYWADLQSGATAPLGDPGQIFHPFVSPDGTRALIEVRDASDEGTDLWLVDLTSGLRTRFTFAVGDESRPCWSPDGASVYYASNVDGHFSIMQQPVEGQGGAAILFEADAMLGPTSASPDGRYLLFDKDRGQSTVEMQRLDLAGGDEPVRTIASADKSLGGGRYSPDGRWIAYHTVTAQGWDVFVIAADGSVRKWQISTIGAVYPRWSPDGRTLYVQTFSGELLAFEVDGSGQTFRVGGSRRSLTVNAPDGSGSFYDVHPDGQRVLGTGPDPAFKAEVSYLHLVTDWRRGLVQ